MAKNVKKNTEISKISIDSIHYPVDKFLSENSIDCIIFGYEDQQLKILLIKWKREDLWMLPGGFIFKNEDMDVAANRILKERTGLQDVFLTQFYTFGNKDRKQTNNSTTSRKLEHLYKELIADSKIHEWFTKRFITTGYIALLDINKAKPKPDFLSEKCEWKAIDELPQLLYDHELIVKKGLNHLSVQLNYLPISMLLLQNKFTMQDLQKLYESILNKKLERSNFQRKMLKLGIFIRLEKQLTGAANKAPYLYCFDKSKYNELIKSGIGFTF